MSAIASIFLFIGLIILGFIIAVTGSFISNWIYNKFLNSPK
jgi:hypothetical protein